MSKIQNMDEEIILVLDYDKICRLCLNNKGALTDIFEETDEFNFVEQVKTVTNVTILADDKLPSKVCHRCRYAVEVGYELIQTVGKADNLLRHSGNPIHLSGLHADEWSSIHEQNVDLKEERIEEDFEPDAATSLEPEDFQHENEKNVEDKTECTKRKYKRHLPNVPKNLFCHVCLRVFSNPDEVRHHAEIEHYNNMRLTSYLDAEKPFKCEECSETNFPTRNSLIVHHRKHLNISPYICDVAGCNFKTKSKESMRQHGFAHADKRHVCELCGAAFKRPFELRQHRSRHSDAGGEFPCRLCRVVCRNRLTLKAHMRYHELGRRFKCTRLGCPKAFYSQSDLLVHQRSHENLRTYRCPYCVSSYISKSQLNRHMQRHSSQRMHKCDKCASSFNDYAAFYNHRVSSHGPWQPYKCRGCNQGYQTSDHCEKHMEICKLAKNILTLTKKEPSNSNCKMGVDNTELISDHGTGYSSHKLEEAPRGSDNSNGWVKADSFQGIRYVGSSQSVVPANFVHSMPGFVDSSETAMGSSNVLYIQIDNNPVNEGTC